jgi:hypothetical protein
MPISRPLLIALAAALLALVGFYATQASRNAASDETAQVAAPANDVAQAPEATAPEPTKAEPAAPEPSTAGKDGTEAAKADAAKPTKAEARRARAVAERREQAARRARAERIGMPLAVQRALNARRTVVIFFRGSGSADDRATARAGAGLRGTRGVTVVSDRIGRLGRYRAVVGDLGISQAPAVVIVDRGRTARVVQGYVDPATLAQDVADTR